jgi:hypothetical protein
VPTPPVHFTYLDDAGAAQQNLDGALAQVEDSMRSIHALLRRLHAETLVPDHVTLAHREVLREISRATAAKEVARIAAGNIAVACLEIRRLPLAISRRGAKRAERWAEAAA